MMRRLLPHQEGLFCIAKDNGLCLLAAALLSCRQQGYARDQKTYFDGLETLLCYHIESATEGRRGRGGGDPRGKQFCGTREDCEMSYTSETRGPNLIAWYFVGSLLFARQKLTIDDAPGS